MLYNQTGEIDGIPMPLIMGYTVPSPIQEAGDFEPIMYDPISQIVYDMREIGTKCLKTTMKSIGGGTSTPDHKNEIDDSKTVN